MSRYFELYDLRRREAKPRTNLGRIAYPASVLGTLRVITAPSRTLLKQLMNVIMELHRVDCQYHTYNTIGT